MHVLKSLPDSFAATRDALHAVAEHVLAPARYRAEQRIGLVPTVGGFGTSRFGDGEQVRVDLGELVHERTGSVRRVALSTLGDAARFVGVPLGAPTHVYAPRTAADPDARLFVDPNAASVLAAWIAFAAQALETLRKIYATHQPSAVQLWPEHFDLACDLGDADDASRANYGASPGDAAIAEPYLYVGPWEASRRTGALGTHPWGAAMTYEELRAHGDPVSVAVEFLTDGAALLVGDA